jgi:hypothetical protein
MDFSLAFVLSAFFVLTILFILSRRDEGRVRRDWQDLTLRSEDVFRNVKDRFDAEIALATLTYDHVFALRERGEADEARRLLEMAFRVIEQFSPNMLKLLSAMAVFSRMVSAIAPLPPLRPQSFRLRQVASLAYLNQFLRRFLVTSVERFRLHIYILGRGIALATRLLLDATRRIVGNEPHAERHWKSVEDAMADLQTLTDQSLESLRALLQSIDRQRAEDTLSDLERPEEEPRNLPDEFVVLLWCGLFVLLLAALQLAR